MKHNRVFACDECDFETGEKDNLVSHRKNDHENNFENESETADSDDDYGPTYRCDLCTYNAMYPDNVALHYVEIHKIKMSWQEAETNCKR